MPFELAPLPYAYNALEPFIDERTMQIHHDKHHQVYVTNLNAAIEKAPELASWSLTDLVVKLNQVPESVRTAVRNHGGGHWNHDFFWNVMAPANSTKASAALSNAIDSAFGSMDNFKAEFEKAALGRFGSGWAWLVVDGAGKLSVVSTANQDNPLTDGLKPVLGVDVWEHAYYLKYQNLRAEYVKQWWNVVNWDQASKNLG